MSVLERASRRLRRTAPPNRHALVGPPGQWEMKRRFQFEFLCSRGLRVEHRLLDIGCGTLRGGIPLIEYLEIGHYTGIEARGGVLDEGRKELAEAGLEHKLPLLIEASDPAHVQLEQPVDIAWAFSVLFHMTDNFVDSYLALVARSLADAGAFYANVNLGDREPDGWQGFPVLWRSESFYADLGSSHGLVMSRIGSLGELGHDSGSATQDQQTMLRFAR
jgi:cyclopropane fatty-acyl-phospholipid synthase-like methyltransferase